MSKRKIKVPGGMLAALEHPLGEWHPSNRKTLEGTLEAALLWQRDHAPVPTDEQLNEVEIALDKQLDAGAPEPGGVWDGRREMIAEWIHRMYDAPELVTPDPISDLRLIGGSAYIRDQANKRLDEAYRRGRASTK